MEIKHPEYLQGLTNIEGRRDIIYKRKEADELENEIKSCLTEPGKYWHKVLHGPTGSGKTLLIKNILYNILKKKENEYLRERVVFIDGNKWKTPKTVLKFIACVLGHRVKSYENEIAFFIDAIEKMVKTSEKQYLFVIDEFDRPLNNSREIPRYNFIHSLLRLNVENIPSILFITNDYKANKVLTTTGELDGCISPIPFKAYDIEDVAKILSLRMKFCLSDDMYDKYLIEASQIAREVVLNPVGSDSANVRKAIKILSKSADLAIKTKKPLTDTVKKAISLCKADDYRIMMKKYNRHQQILLVTLSLMTQNKQKQGVDEGLYKYVTKEIKLKDIMSNFKTVTGEEGIKTVTDRQVKTYVDQFVKENFLSRLGLGEYSFNEDSELIVEAYKEIKKEEGVV